MKPMTDHFSRRSRPAILAPVLGLVLGVAASTVFADGQAIVTERTLSFNAAHDAAMAALEQCRKDGFHVSVTVLNRAGRTAVVLHDDGAPMHTIENSLRKAYTALTFGVPSGDFGKRVASNPTSIGAMNLDRITSLEGGLPIIAGKEVVGSIGVSGAPTGPQDIACVNAGIARIAKGLTGG